MSRLDELLRYKLPETVTVELPGGERFEFRCLQSRAQIAEQQAAVELFKQTLETEPIAWQPYLPIAPEAIPEIVFLAENYLGDDMTQTDWIRLQHEAGMIFSLIYQQYLLKISEIIARNTKQEIESAKKNSDETVSTERT